MRSPRKDLAVVTTPLWSIRLLWAAEDSGAPVVVVHMSVV
ncbi:hypothetical protein TSMEX_003424, partial [Taenia solium]